MVSDLTLLGAGEALQSSVNTIISEFHLTREWGSVVRSTARKMTLNPHEGRSKHITTYDGVTAFDLADGVDLVQAQTVTDNPNVYSPDEVGVQVIVAGSTLRRSADKQLRRNTATILNNAYSRKEDSDGAAQFTSFTNSVGGAGVVMSPGHADAMASRLQIGNSNVNAEPAPKPWALVMYPMQVTPLRGRVAGLSSTPGGAAAFGAHGGAHAGVAVANNPNEMQQRLLENGPGSLQKWAGFNVKETANIPVDANDDAILGAYSTEGLIFVSELEARIDADTTNKSMRGAIELNAWGSYTYGVYRPDAFSVQGTFDASIPTS